MQEKVEYVSVKARSEVRGTGSAVNSAVAEVVAEAIATVVADAVVVSKGCGNSGSTPPPESTPPPQSPEKQQVESEPPQQQPSKPPPPETPAKSSTARSISGDCNCAEDGVSGGVSTGRFGCAQHLKDSGDDGWFCYVQGGGKCGRATESESAPGAYWVDCIKG